MWMATFTPGYHKIFLLEDNLQRRAKVLNGFLQIWSYLLKKSWMENFIFCAAFVSCHFVMHKKKFIWAWHSGHNPPFCSRGGGEGLSLQPNFKKWGAWRTSTFREGLLGKREWLFSGGLQFSHKNKLKSELFNDKKSL